MWSVLIISCACVILYFRITNNYDVTIIFESLKTELSLTLERLQNYRIFLFNVNINEVTFRKLSLRVLFYLTYKDFTVLINGNFIIGWTPKSYE